MNRAERRQRTDRIVNRRARQWREFYDGEEPDPARKGSMRNRSPFDCGKSDCYCSEPNKTDAYRDRNA